MLASLAALTAATLLGIFIGRGLRRPLPPAPPKTAHELALAELQDRYLHARGLRRAALRHANDGYPGISTSLEKQAVAAEARADAFQQRVSAVSELDQQILDELRQAG